MGAWLCLTRLLVAFSDPKAPGTTLAVLGDDGQIRALSSPGAPLGGYLSFGSLSVGEIGGRYSEPVTLRNISL